MFWNARFKWGYWRFNRAVRGIHETPPMPVRPGRCTIVSMVGARDTLMYLVAMKAFYRRLGSAGHLVAIVARNAPPEQAELLTRHFPGIELQVIEEIDVGDCQRGGCWERLLYILDRTDRGEYVVQIDCDVMPTGEDIGDLLRCVETGTAFTMADHFKICTAREAAEFARTIEDLHIQNQIEKVLDRLPDAGGLRYIRGSAGLAGFAPRGFTRRAIEAFHRDMEAMIGRDRWRRWGTEQCASNFAVANTAGAVSLPFPAYTSFHNGGPREGVKMYHFIGSFRFDEGTLIRLAKREIAVLRGRA
ncbi:MAG TPA: hypothetical protein VGN83_20720 [Falsiroseomonas sp.]|jgi:hypothetical protein|nr:hypothetical protein [Falsiroseomonas sp.]